jgi:hypothetical protein
LRPEDIDQVYDGATPNRFAALSSGAVQAALLGQPFDFRAAQLGYKKLLDIGSYAKDYGFLTLMARPKWLAENPMARAPICALGCGDRLIYDPANQGEGWAIWRGTKPRYGSRIDGDYYSLRPSSIQEPGDPRNNRGRNTVKITSSSVTSSSRARGSSHLAERIREWIVNGSSTPVPRR